MKNGHRGLLVLCVLSVLTSIGFAQDAKKDQKVYVEGNHLEYTTTNRISIITGSPVVVKDVASGMELKCQMLKVHWATNNSGIDKAYADGKVIITMKDKDGVQTATGEHATYDGRTDVITLTGDPVLETPMGRMWNAERVIYERSIGKFSAAGGKIKGEFKMQKLDLKKPVAAPQAK